ncbi:MAG: EAL domain-containing protein [Desulfuromonadaceae bacterium]|nr:EAL domain-containing protein [Desulfuromonadaceae bacterium]MDD5105821.1 EAL domain-containing protein [Desulfuromonadaceae bacterium]
MTTENSRYFLGRQPVLDVDQVIIGYELLFRAADCNYATIVDYSVASASVIASALAGFGLHSILGDKLGFINVNQSIFFSELLEVLPVNQTVLELLEFVDLDDHAKERCLELKKMGFRLSLDDHVYNSENDEIYQIVDFIKLDILEIPTELIPVVVTALNHYPIQLVAEKVETIGQFNDCKQLGLNLFQGYFFERPEVLKRNSLDSSQMEMMRLLRRLMTEADIGEIEELFRQSPALSFQLLTLVNSVSLGLREKIKGLRHAITILGIDKLRRWVQLALFATADERGVNNPLLEMAAVRGRLIEHLIMQRHKLFRGSELVDAAFMTGIFSLLDVLFDTSMEVIVSNLSLSEEISDALLNRQGELGLLLSLAETLEITNFGGVEELLAESGISIENLLQAQLHAFTWRDSVAA